MYVIRRWRTTSFPGRSSRLRLRDGSLGLRDRRYSYRIVFIPETIGSIVYISRHLDELAEDTSSRVSCSRASVTIAPTRSCGRGTVTRWLIVRRKLVLKRHAPDHVDYSYLDRGSDERQYCSPGVDLPVASIMRTRYNSYPEYHTSLDDLTSCHAERARGRIRCAGEDDRAHRSEQHVSGRTPCEPQLGKRGLVSNARAPAGPDMLFAR